MSKGPESQMWLCPGWAQLQLCLDKSCLQIADNRSDYMCSLITPRLSTPEAAQCCRCPEQGMAPSRKSSFGVGSVALGPHNRALQSWAGWEASPCSAGVTRGCFAWTQGRIWPLEFVVCLGEGQGSLCWRHREKLRHHSSECSSDAWCCAGECHGCGFWHLCHSVQLTGPFFAAWDSSEPLGDIQPYRQ